MTSYSRARRSLRRGVLPAIVAIATLGAPYDVAHAQKRQRAPATEAGYELAFVDADVKRVVDAVLGAMMGADYAIDPAVTGNVTLRTSRPVPRAELVPLLEQALRGIGAVIVAENGRYRVVTRGSARVLPPSPSNISVAAPETPGNTVSLPPLAPGFASETIDLKSASAPQIAKLIEQMVGKEVVTNVEPALNRLTVSGSAEERGAVRQIVQRFDVDTLADMAFEFYKLENVDPDTLVAELQRVFQPPYDILGSRVRVLALPRLRSLLVIASDRGDISRIDPWIRRLDTGVAGKRRLYSYSLQNGRARDIARTLQQVIGTGAGYDSGPVTDIPQPQPIAADGTAESGDPTAEPVPASPPIEASGGGNGPRVVPNEAVRRQHQWHRFEVVK